MAVDHRLLPLAQTGLLSSAQRGELGEYVAGYHNVIDHGVKLFGESYRTDEAVLRWEDRIQEARDLLRADAAAKLQRARCT